MAGPHKAYWDTWWVDLRVWAWPERGKGALGLAHPIWTKRVWKATLPSWKIISSLAGTPHLSCCLFPFSQHATIGAFVRTWFCCLSRLMYVLWGLYPILTSPLNNKKCVDFLFHGAFTSILILNKSWLFCYVCVCASSNLRNMC